MSCDVRCCFHRKNLPPMGRKFYWDTVSSFNSVFLPPVWQKVQWYLVSLVNFLGPRSWKAAELAIENRIRRQKSGEKLRNYHRSQEYMNSQKLGGRRLESLTFVEITWGCMVISFMGPENYELSGNEKSLLLARKKPSNLCFVKTTICNDMQATEWWLNEK